MNMKIMLLALLQGEQKGGGGNDTNIAPLRIDHNDARDGIGRAAHKIADII